MTENKSTIQATPSTLLDLWGTMQSLGAINSHQIADILGYTPRQGSYYGPALHAFGIATKTNHGRNFLYEIKDKYIIFDPKIRAEKLKEIVSNKKTISRIMKHTNNLKGNTKKRRKNDLNKFISYDYDSYKKSSEYLSVQKNPNEDSDYKKQKDLNNLSKGIFTSIKDKSIIHRRMANVIIEYAEFNNIQLKQENLNADLTSFNPKTNTLSIIEIKSYNAPLLAIGQLLHYENRFKNTIYKQSDIKYKKVYVTNKKIDSEKKDLLLKLNIKYILLDKNHLKNIFE